MRLSASLLVGLALAACAPGLESRCERNGQCRRGEACVAGVCTGVEADGRASGDAGSEADVPARDAATVPDTDAGHDTDSGHDARGADLGTQDAALPARDARATDLGPPDAALRDGGALPCEPGTADDDGDPLNGCERGCSGGSQSGALVTTLDGLDGLPGTYPGDIAVAVGEDGLAGVAYLDLAVAANDLQLSVEGGAPVAVLPGRGGAWSHVALARTAGRWVVFGDHSGRLGSDYWFGAAIHTDAAEQSLVQFAFAGGVRPGAVALSDIQGPRAHAFFGLEDEQRGVGLQQRTLFLNDGQARPGVFLGPHRDYRAGEVHTFAFAEASGAVVLAPAGVDQALAYRVLRVGADGTATIWGTANSTVPATLVAGGAMYGARGLIVARGAENELMGWPVDLDAPIGEAIGPGRVVDPGPVEQVAATAGPAGPTVFLRAGDTYRAMPLRWDLTAVLPAPVEVIRDPNGYGVRMLRVTSGPRLFAAWLARDAADTADELRIADLACR